MGLRGAGALALRCAIRPLDADTEQRLPARPARLASLGSAHTAGSLAPGLLERDRIFIASRAVRIDEDPVLRQGERWRRQSRNQECDSHSRHGR
jgi:hypothetical protein